MEWKDLRRGCYLGGESSRERLVDLTGKAMAGRQRTSHWGPAWQAHDERAAARLLRLGLEAQELRPADLGGMPKGAPEKAVLAAWLRQRMTASLGWIAERLGMGHESRGS